MLSIIVPVFNGEKFIKKLYTLFVKLKFPSELVFVDNVSEDKSVSIIKSITHIDSRVKLTSEIHKGAAFARLKGVQMALYDTIYFIDVDDEFIPQNLSVLLSLFNADDYDFVFGRRSSIDHKVYAENDPRNTASFAVNWIQNLSQWNGTASFIYRKSTILNELAKVVNLRLGEDIAVNSIIASNYSGCFKNISIFNYVRHPNSTTRVEGKRKHKAITYMTLRSFCLHNIELFPQEEIKKAILKSYLFNAFAIYFLPKTVINSDLNQKQAIEGYLLEYRKYAKINFMFSLLSMATIKIKSRLFFYYITVKYIKRFI